MRPIHRAALALCVAVLVLVLLGNNLGQDRIPLSYGGQLLFTVRVGAPGLTAPQRAEIVQQRLLRAINWQFENPNEQPVPEKIKIRRVGENALIVCGPLSIVTVTPLDARANKTSVNGLATIWCKRVAKVLEIATQTG